MTQTLTLIMFSGELDKALAGFNIAIGASAVGIDTTIYFTFWGLNIIRKKGGLIKGKSIKQKLLNLMNRGGSDGLPLSRFNMFNLGPWMMKNIMKNSHMPTLRQMIALAKIQDVKFVACSSSLEMMGLKKDDLIEEVDEIAGVATYLNIASKSKINLFI